MIGQMLTNTIAVILYLGVPVIPLIILAIKVGQWHEDNADPLDVF
jgi:hypothetical protein